MTYKNLWLIAIGCFLWFMPRTEATAQVLEPVEWSFDSKTLDNGMHQLFFTAKMDDGWFVYSQDIEEGGPIPTSFEFEESSDYDLKGKIREKGELIEKFDKMFDMNIKKYPGEVTFVATIKPKKDNVKVKGYLTFMTCDDSRCLPPDDVDFEFDLTKKAAPAETKPAENGNGLHEVAPAGSGAQSGILEPVKWAMRSESLGNDDYLLHFAGTIDDGWYVYSQELEPGGPLPTSFEFETKSGIELVGNVKEVGKLIQKKEKIFNNMMVRKYAKKVEFQQKVKVTRAAGKVAGYFTFMTCDNGRCLPPEDVEFAFNLSGSGTGAVDGSTDKTGLQSGGEIPTEIVAAVKDEKEIEQKEIETAVDNVEVDKELENVNAVAVVDRSKTNASQVFDEVIADCGVDTKKDEAKKSIWLIFILGFLGGFAALLTPCVFPMIPLTVSFFTKQSKDKAKGIKNALIYSLSIIVIYVALGFFVTVAFGPDFLNAMSTNPWVNLAFFAVFLVFAISFFGFFEITLPNSLINKSDTAADKGGLIGIFFMAFTLALVSFSCTGPIIGTLLVEAAVGGARVGPMVGMFGFSFALALPFFLFAAFPGWLNSLPSSGGWLDTVKKVLGFIELIFALKFLSNADMVPQWGILPREIFIAIWAVLLFGLGFYLLGFIKLPHDSPANRKNPIRMGLSGLSILLGFLLIPGIFLKPIPLIGSSISGFPPPTFYNIANLWGDGDGQEEDGIHGIMDLEKGIAKAKKDGKPLLIDFTGWACVNCRKMEENVWPKLDELMEKYTLVSLYVDESVKLPKEEQFTYTQNGKRKKVRTVGNKWSYLQTKCFGTNSQPYYILMNHEGEYLNPPRGYTPHIKDYATFLEEGIDNFQNGQTLLSSNE